MKRIKYIALALVLMLGLIGGAYAYWQDTLTVEGTVNTGSMKVIITEARAPGIEHGEVPYVTAGPRVIADDGKSAEFSVSNIYPSDKVWLQNFRVRTKNDGTIPVKLDDLEFYKLAGSDNSEVVWSSLKGQVHLRLIDPDGTWGLVPGSSAVFEFQHGIEDAIEGLMDSYGALKPGQTAQFVIWFWLDPTTCGNDAQQEEIAFRLTYNWIQWNAP